MENSWNSSRRIFLHVGYDVASFFLPSKALLYCYLCLASSLFPARADACEKQRSCFHCWGPQCVCGTRSPGALCGGKGSQLRGKRNLAALVSLKLWAGQNSSARLSLRTQSSHGENKRSSVNHYQTLRSGLELAGHCSFFALLSATSVYAWSKAFGNSNLDWALGKTFWAKGWCLCSIHGEQVFLVLFHVITCFVKYVWSRLFFFCYFGWSRLDYLESIWKFGDCLLCFQMLSEYKWPALTLCSLLTSDSLGSTRNQH